MPKRDEERPAGQTRSQTRRQAEAVRTQAELKAAAKRVFARQGYLNTKITDITAEAGRATGSFYNHFVGKEALLESMLADMLAAGDATVAEPESGHSADFTDPAAVRWHIAAYWRFYRGHTVELTALRQAALVSEEFAERVRRMNADDDQHLIGHLDHITRAGRSLPGAPETVVAVLSGLIDGYTRSWHETDPAERTPEDEAIDVLTTFAYRALNGRDP